MIPPLAEQSAQVEAIKTAVTGYDRLGGGEPFELFNALMHYDRVQSRWLLPRHDIPLTLLTKGQLDLIERAVHYLEARDVRGDYIEAGVWRGGAIAFMRALLDINGIANRQVVAADSFSGIPKNTRFKHDPVDLWDDRWEAGIDEVRDNIRQHGCLDDKVEFLEGYFEETLPTLSDRQFALIRLDSDSYDSVLTSLEHLYPRLSAGGIIIIDDWHLPGCRFAIDRFRIENGIVAPVDEDSGNGYWIKD
jgi:O-methyltransferase